MDSPEASRHDAPHAPHAPPHDISTIWDWLARVAGDTNSDRCLFSIATLNEAGAPEVRLMVLRHADREAGSLFFHTDIHSPKVAQIHHLPAVSACAYDADRRIELRVAGTARVLPCAEAPDDAWRRVLGAVHDANDADRHRHDARSGESLMLWDPELSGRLREDSAMIELRVDNFLCYVLDGADSRQLCFARDRDWDTRLLPAA